MPAGHPYHATVTVTSNPNEYTVAKPSGLDTPELLERLTLVANQDFEFSADDGSTWFAFPTGVRSASNIACRGILSLLVRRTGGGAITVTGVFE